MNNEKILVDIVVSNCQILARKMSPNQAPPMPNDDVSSIFAMGHGETMNRRLKGCVYGGLRGRSLRKAEKIVERNGSISTLGKYGSILQ